MEQLDSGLSLMKAPTRDFAIHYTTYRENVFFRQTWERRIAIFEDGIPCYWLIHEGKRIGGVCVEPNLLWALYLEPPFTDMHRVVGVLKRYLMKVSNKDEPIEVIGILPYQEEYFLRLGFKPVEKRRIMIRPTERLQLCKLPDGIVIEPLKVDHLEEIALLSFNAYSGVDCIGMPVMNTIEQQRADLEFYFEHTNDELLRKSSSVVFDKGKGKMVGVCLVSMWEDLPLIANVAVDPDYRGNGIANNLLKKSLTMLKKQHEVVRLFVTVGNAAESLYYDLGFLPGLEQITFVLPVRQ